VLYARKPYSRPENHFMRPILLIRCVGRQEVAAPLAKGSIIVRSRVRTPNVSAQQDRFRWSCTRQLRGTGSIQAPRWRMTPMFMLLVAWGVLTGVLIILLIYKSTLTMHEDDSIFLNESESQMHKDQVEVLAKMKKIGPIVKILGALSGVMILVIAGLFIYQGLSNSTTLQ
jgi:hypothetical protein